MQPVDNKRTVAALIVGIFPAHRWQRVQRKMMIMNNMETTIIPKRTSSEFQRNPSAAEKRKDVTFKLEAGSAKEVLLAGDFTNWEKTPIKLRKGVRGAWNATIKLAPGQYHYKFLVDGKWQNDPAAIEKCPNPFGSSDNVLKIS